MPALTANQDIPYMIGTDFLGEVDLRIKAVADYFEALMSARAKVYRNANQTLTTAVSAALSWDAEESDPGGLHDLVTNPSRLTVVTPGRYQVFAQVAFAANATGSRTVEIKKSGTVVAHVRVAPVTGLATVVLALADELATAGQYFEVFATQTSGANLDAAAGIGNTWASAQKIGEV